MTVYEELLKLPIPTDVSEWDFVSGGYRQPDGSLQAPPASPRLMDLAKAAFAAIQDKGPDSYIDNVMGPSIWIYPMFGAKLDADRILAQANSVPDAVIALMDGDDASMFLRVGDAAFDSKAAAREVWATRTAKTADALEALGLRTALPVARCESV